MATELIGIGILFFCAIIGGIIAARFKQPAVFGMLLIGAIIGPSSLNIVKDANMIEMMAELGAVLILFVIGLEFDISKLIKLGARSILIGFLKFAIVLFFGYETTLLVGFDAKTALFIGVILSFSSTVVIVKVLEQKEMFRRKEVPLLIAVLIIEDILAVLALTFFSGIRDSGRSILSTFEHVTFSIAILIFAYLIIMKILRFIVNIILKNSSDESVLIFLSLSIGALFSYFAFYLGLTPSAGAFLAGSLIASLPNSKEYGRAVHPIAMILTSIFFISMGTMVNFKAVESNLALIIALILTILVTRLIAVGFLTLLLANFKNEQAFFSSIAMISVGEFSLLIAKESQKFGVDVDLVTITASIIFITAILMSIGINYSERLHNALNSRIPIKARLKIERMSEYMRRFFDQMEIETHFTKKLKSESRITLMLFILALFAFFVLRRVSLAMKISYNAVVLYVFYAISFILMIYLLNLVYKRSKVVHHTLSVILTNVDSSRNIKKCDRILDNLLLALLLFFSAMLFPFAIFVFNLNIWANVIPFLLITASFYYLRNSVALIDGHSLSSSGVSASIAVTKF
ncbi:cation:proton antiporter [Candidatus Woesearchaeota archaeon]|nr:cation:proton antiporter [Candidatus Woesearchaeota archaeon]